MRVFEQLQDRQMCFQLQKLFTAAKDASFEQPAAERCCLTIKLGFKQARRSTTQCMTTGGPRRLNNLCKMIIFTMTC